jgi:hypothetical protein
MTAKETCAFVMPFGKHKGKTLCDIAVDDPDGARYLDWVVGLSDLRPDLHAALKSFLAIPWVEKMVEESMNSREYDEPPENTHGPRPWWEK